MPRIKLKTDVANWGLLKWPARTRGTLIASVLIATALTYAFGLWSASHIIDVSSSVILNLLIITANMMFLLVAAFLQAVLVADLTFVGPWRERVFLGHRPPEDEIDPMAVEDRSAEFVIVIILLVVANAFCINIAAGGFLDRYHNEGFFQVRLRAEAPSERIAALNDLAEAVNFELWERPVLQDAIIATFEDRDPEVARQAVWNAGRMKLRNARQPLLAIVADTKAPSRLRAEAAISAGKLGDDTDTREFLERHLGQESTDAILQVGLLRGLGLIASPKSMPTLLPLLEAQDEQVMVHAFWALNQTRNQDARPIIHEILEREAPGVRRCAALDAIKLVGSSDDTLWARRQFQRAAHDETCAAIIWEDHDGSLNHILWGESVRVKLLKTVANTNPFPHRDWLQRLVNDPDEAYRVREVANEILKQMDRAKPR